MSPYLSYDQQACSKAALSRMPAQNTFASELNTSLQNTREFCTVICNLSIQNNSVLKHHFAGVA